jgi:hypothetical protein
MSTSIIGGLEVCDINGDNPVKLNSVYTKDAMPVSKDHIPRKEDISQWPHMDAVDLPQINADVSLLIGNGVAEAYTPLEIVTGPKGSPHATKTALGWIAWNVVRKGSGIKSLSANRAEIKAIENMQELQELDQLVRSSINMDFPERLIDDKREPSQEDHKFTKIVESSIELCDGHYKMKLPFRDENVKLPDNRDLAKQRLKGLKNRMTKDEKFNAHYKAFMENMLEKGFAEEVPTDEEERNDGRVWYIPHHGVYHPKKPDKIRVVFDCAAKFQGTSLNNVLLQGPDLTNNLVGVLLRFRQEPVAITSDIEQMFYQVKVAEEDRDLSRFYWWPDGDIESTPKSYRMTVHVFGATSSPSCANTALRKTAMDHKDQYSPDVVDSMLRSFYVDDNVKSVKDEDTAVKLAEGLRGICKDGGFRLTKWISNSRKFLSAIPEGELAKGVMDLDLNQDTLPVERALGIYWSVESDTLGFRNQVTPKPATRRGILSIVSSVYDPLGLAAPFVLPGRVLLQELCQKNIGWDEPISQEDQKKWQQWLEELPKLETLEVKRCHKPVYLGEIKSCQLHHFSDASEKGYGTGSYVRFEDQEGHVSCSLMLGKTRVSPLKKVTIPWLELTAAMKAVEINHMMLKELDYPVDESYYWTDSQCVLRYIANDTTRLLRIV